MARPSDLPLYLKSYKLIIYLYLLVAQFPKSYKFSLGGDILQCVWGVLDCVIEANSLPNNQKREPIIKAVAWHDKCLIRIRLAHELKLMSDKKYAFVMEQNEEIGKMLAGWLAWSKRS